MTSPVDTSAEAVLKAMDSLSELLLAMVEERAEQETLLAERNRQNAAAWTELDRLQKLEALLFDGHAVLSGLPQKARGRTSPENVSDVLDALVELTRRERVHP